MSLRNDKGELFENFLFIERVKRNEHLRSYANVYFWRTYNQQEIDFIEESDGMLNGYEFKYTKSSSKGADAFRKTYSEAGFTVINKENYISFVSG